jgi:ornithine carbamoyltransferase
VARFDEDIMIASDFLSIRDFTPHEIREFIELARLIKSNPELFTNSLAGKTLALIFEKPSLRTRVSFDVGFSSSAGFLFTFPPPKSISGNESRSTTSRKTLSAWCRAS